MEKPRIVVVILDPISVSALDKLRRPLAALLGKDAVLDGLLAEKMSVRFAIRANEWPTEATDGND